MRLVPVYAVVLAALTVPACSSALTRTRFVLARDGRATAKIVTAGEVDRPFDKGVNNQAVRDLVRIVAVMSGAVLPVVEDSKVFAGGPQIHIGATAFARRAGLVPTDLPRNGYRLVVTAEAGQPRLVIAGTGVLGSSHGVYDLLTRELGVMWGMANSLFEDIPRRRTVAVGPLDRVGRPSFGVRRMSGLPQEWLLRQQLDAAHEEMPYARHGHNLISLFPVSQYRDHPEYYALFEGSRLVPESDADSRKMVCLTHPDVIRITIEKVRAYFDANPNAPGFSLCASDDDTFCQCTGCAALDAGRPSFRLRDRVYSDSYFHFVASVASALLTSHPDRYVSAYAYDVTEPPPRRIERLPRNVVVYLTQDPSQHFDPAYEREDATMLREWRRVARHVCTYEYPGLGWLMPRNHPTLIARRFAQLRQAGVDGVYMEAGPHWANAGPTYYLAARLAWDASQAPGPLLDTWYHRMFREAAPHMKAYYEQMDRAWMRSPGPGVFLAGLNRLWEQLAAWPPSAREAAWRHLQRARAAARSDIVRRRVEYVLAGHAPTCHLARAFEQAHYLTPRSSEADIRRVLARFDAFMASFLAAIESSPDYGDASYQGSRFHEMTKWIKLDILRCVEGALAGRKRLRDRLEATVPALSEMVDTSGNPRTVGYCRWTNRDMRRRAIYPRYLSGGPPYLPE